MVPSGSLCWEEYGFADNLPGTWPYRWYLLVYPQSQDTGILPLTQLVLSIQIFPGILHHDHLKCFVVIFYAPVVWAVLGFSAALLFCVFAYC